jgi:hypothetical protein
VPNVVAPDAAKICGTPSWFRNWRTARFGFVPMTLNIAKT